MPAQLHAVQILEPDPEPSFEEIAFAEDEDSDDDTALLRIQGRIMNKEVTFEIDSGANRNFMSLSTAKCLGYKPTRRSVPDTVSFADSHGLLATHYVIVRERFGIGLVKHQVVVFDLLDIKLDVILGINWTRHSNLKPQIDRDNYRVQIRDQVLYSQDGNLKVSLLTVMQSRKVAKAA
ncbi:hypothetical protein BGX27_001095 [Mortierella sp. AM989]|nr:hypothetical protein BGX27_001095 [Mortierella sp. AM989]